VKIRGKRLFYSLLFPQKAMKMHYENNAPHFKDTQYEDFLVSDFEFSTFL
jgi:hypothetical protein